MANDNLNETKTCKYCQSEIPKKAKICPSCRKKQKGKGSIIATVIVIILVLGLIGSCFGGSDDSTKVDNSTAKTTTDSSSIKSDDKGSDDDSSNDSSDDASTSDEETDDTSSQENVVEVGGSFEAKGLKVTINDASIDYQLQDDQFGIYTLDEGLMYIAVSFTFENTGSSDAYVSIYDFDCYANNSSCEQKFVPDGGDFINTNLSSGRNTSFTTFYAVPTDSETIELEYTANIWTNEKVVVKVR